MISIESGDVLGLAAAVSAAVETGLLGVLAEGPVTAGQAARRLEVDPTATARVYDVLVAARLATHDGEAYALAPDLVAMHRAFPGGLTLTAMLFATAGQYVRTGQPAWAMDGDVAQRGEAYRSTVAGLAGMFAGASAAFAAAFASRVPARARVVDVGCGSGVWGLSVLERIAGATLTGVDLPPVLDVFRETAGARGLADRIVALPGDMHEVALPEGEVVILANVLRLEPPPRAATLLSRLSAAVAPGGMLVIVDALAEGTPDRDVARAVYALNLSLRTRGASVHAPTQVAAWMAGAGLVDVTPLDFGVWPGAVAAWVGRKPQ